MRRSLRIGSVAGIGIYLHWTFVVLLAGIFGFYLWQGNSVAAALAGAGLILAVFACVILHELGHALTARRFDVPTRDITIYPIGGIARLARIPEESMKEFWIAVAGPAVNVVIAVILAALVAGTNTSWMPQSIFEPQQQNVLATLLWINLVLAVFNMLPAFPMDGGRVLRALLATRLSYARATQVAANVGQGMALLFALLGVGLLGAFNPVLIFIALFVYLGARQEARQATLRSATQDLRVWQAMMTRFTTLALDDPLADAADELLTGSDHDFPILEDGTVRGILSREHLIKALSEHGREAPIRAARVDECFTVEAGEMLDEVFQRMRGRSCSTVPVLENGRLVGLLTLENVGELMMISSALGKENVPRRLTSSKQQRRLST